MKNYKKIFAEENKFKLDRKKKLISEIDKRERKIINFMIALFALFWLLLIYFCYGWTFLGFPCWEWAANFYKNIDENDLSIRISITISGLILLFAIACVVISILCKQLNKRRQKAINADDQDLKEKAKEFAASTYLNDIISALSTVFTLDTSFIDKFKEIIVKFKWFDYDGFNVRGYNVTYFYNEDKYGTKVWIQDKLIIRHEGSKYLLKKWIYGKNSFRFFFEKIHANGLVEKDVEYRLPVEE